MVQKLITNPIIQQNYGGILVLFILHCRKKPEIKPGIRVYFLPEACDAYAIFQQKRFASSCSITNTFKEKTCQFQCEYSSFVRQKITSRNFQALI